MTRADVNHRFYIIYMGIIAASFVPGCASTTDRLSGAVDAPEVAPVAEAGRRFPCGSVAVQAVQGPCTPVPPLECVELAEGWPERVE